MPLGQIWPCPVGRFSINLNFMSLQCDNLSGELQDQWSSSLNLDICNQEHEDTIKNLCMYSISFQIFLFSDGETFIVDDGFSDTGKFTSDIFAP